ncbi:hypothetical protein Mro03_46660 [Microbispora rosea subsp. rosea]|nr:hypothetical protein Mro03_46660 [Microbispora rosea subsp. rosea]
MTRDPRSTGGRRTGSATGGSRSQHSSVEERIAMYEMYPWGRSEDAEDEAAAALQIALDRRDNGGVPQR